MTVLSDPIDDELLVQLSREQLAGDPATQLLAELYTRLRELRVRWWAPADLRAKWPAVERLAWFADRPDIRQRVCHRLTGLAPRAARIQTVDVQAALIDAVIEAGDVSVDAFEHAFDPSEMAVHAPAGAIWHHLRANIPWESNAPEDKAFIAAALRALLAERGDVENGRGVAILTPLIVRSAIDGRAWHEHLPVDVRVAVDAARLRREWESPGRPFDARAEIELVGIERLVEHVPLVQFRGVFDAAERSLRALGSQAAGPAPETLPLDDVGPSMAARRPTPRVHPMRPKPSPA